MRLTPEREQEIEDACIEGEGFDAVRDLLEEVHKLRQERDDYKRKFDLELIAASAFEDENEDLKKGIALEWTEIKKLRERIAKLRKALIILRENSASVWEGRISGEAIVQDDEDATK